MSFKILLLSPPIYDYYYTKSRVEPLGLLYIDTALRAIPGITVDFYDARVSGRKKQLARPAVFSSLDEIYSEDTSYFSLPANYSRYGDSTASIIAKIKKENYNLVGISALFSGYFPDVDDLASAIRAGTSALIAVGGWAVDAEDERMFIESSADFFLKGSGETAFPALVEALIGRRRVEDVPGLVFCSGKGAGAVPPVPSPVPEWFPARHGHYRFRGKKIAAMVIGRGCPNRCVFCAVRRAGDYSRRSIQSIESELKNLAESGVEIVDFEDDNLFDDPVFAGEFISLLKEYHGRGLGFAAMNGMTASFALPFINDLVDAGFIEFNFSMVTGSGALAGAIDRPFAPEIIEEAVGIINGRVETLVFCILGLPGSSPESDLGGILRLARLPVTIGVSPLYLLPGVPALESMGLPDDRRLLRGSALYRFGEGFSREDVASLWKFARMVNRMKHFGPSPDQTDAENLRYFKKSLNDRLWHRRLKNGEWERGFRFGIEMPQDVPVWSFNSSEIKVN